MSIWFQFAIAATLAGSLYVFSRVEIRMRIALCTSILFLSFLFPLIRLNWPQPFLIPTFLGLLQVAIYLACFIWEKRNPSVKYEPFSKAMIKGVAYLLFQPLVIVAGVAYLTPVLKPLLGPPAGLQAHHVPLWIQVILFSLAYDLQFYIFHRAYHNFDFLWRFHKVHHSPTEVTSLTWANKSLPEMLFITVPVAAVMTLLMDVDPAAVSLGVFISFALGGPFSHANVDFPRAGTQPLWARIVVSPSFHREHHTVKRMRGNYAVAFPIWDLLFGTYSMPNEAPRDFGIRSRKYSEMGIWGDLVAPLFPQSKFPEDPVERQ